MEKKPWEADFTVDKHLATRLITSQFNKFKTPHIQYLGAGWDNTVYLINEQIVFRFPRREISSVLMLNEIRLLPEIQKKIAGMMPRLKYIGSPCDIYPWNFAGYPIVPGHTADSFLLTSKERGENISLLAQFLKNLHSIDTRAMQALGAPNDNMSRLDVDLRKPMTLKSLKNIEDKGLADVGILKNYINTFKHDTFFDAPMCLNHGDLYAKHVLLDDNKKLCGIIDWGDLHIGNPAIDFALIHSFAPSQYHQKFKDIYGCIADPVWELARFRAIYSSAAITNYAVDIKLQALRQEGLQGLQFIAQALDDNG